MAAAGCDGLCDYYVILFDPLPLNTALYHDPSTLPPLRYSLSMSQDPHQAIPLEDRPIGTGVLSLTRLYSHQLHPRV